MSSTRMRDGWLLVEHKPAKPGYRVLLLPGLQGSDLVYSRLMNVSTLEENGMHLIAGNPPGFRCPMWWLTYMMMKSIFKPYFDDKNLLRAVTADGRAIPRAVGRNILMGYFDHIDAHGNLVDLLKRTKIPVWYVRGDRDDIGFKKEYRSALEASAKIRIREIPGARDFAMADKPDELAQCIIEMLRAAPV